MWAERLVVPAGQQRMQIYQHDVQLPQVHSLRCWEITQHVLVTKENCRSLMLHSELEMLEVLASLLKEA